MVSKWNGKLPMIREMVGVASTDDIAKAIGTTRANLHKICHRASISLPRDPDTYKGGRKASTSNLDKAVDMLIKAGYRVYAPDPFNITRG